MPLVSVITPVYNAARWLPETIASVQAQTLTDWEHILVDDGSMDDSVTIAGKVAAEDPRIKVLRMPQNSGPAAARNCALQAAQSRFIAFLDADDLWLPEKLARQTAWMTEHGYGFTYHDYRHMSHDGLWMGTVVSGPETLNMHTLHTQRGVGIFTVMIDRQCVPAFKIPQGFAFYLHEDFITWLQLIQQGYKGHRLSVDLGRYRLVAGSLDANKFRAAQKVWRIYRDVSKLPFSRAAWWWIQYAWNAFWARRHNDPKRGAL